MNAGTLSQRGRGWLRSTPIHIPAILESGNDNYRLHTSQTLKHTFTAGDQSSGTDSIELSTQPHWNKGFPLSLARLLYKIHSRGFVLYMFDSLYALSLYTLLLWVWVFKSFSVCVCGSLYCP